MTSGRRATQADVWAVSLRNGVVQREQDLLLTIRRIQVLVRSGLPREERSFAEAAHRVVLWHMRKMPEKVVQAAEPLSYFEQVCELLLAAECEVELVPRAEDDLWTAWACASAIAESTGSQVSRMLMKQRLSGPEVLCAACGVVCFQHMSHASILMFLREHTEIDSQQNQFFGALARQATGLSTTVRSILKK